MTVPERQTDRKRAAILQAAIAEFRRNGFAATSMDQIAATAGVSKRTVYNHFPGKEDLFEAILLQLWHSATTEQHLLYQHGVALSEQLRPFLQSKLHMFGDLDFLDLVRVAVAATIHTPERARDIVDRLRGSETAIVSWLRAAQADQQLRAADPVLMADMLLGQLKSLAFWPQVAMGQAALDAVQQEQVLSVTLGLFLAYYQSS
ncbi:MULTISPECIES: TetR/AcrR family transcriptional regulator [unclassified Undibacterium]|uniref:TetR/AcrR family transcriptional regulator n=1 Tax=unclassified Undibacterium TaxID=2630295 RepID=UPI002AC8AAD1|nr:MULTISPECIES: TetR/AcrR family transcriptional regulator [unclassified Undibacterium]MEB0140029.1 TetR/AcrR family transcriptional regulator [Undibacterium sp. CCC2.1]MEB0173058.1 TetR/AcrR family transcriptional regulator [Undibacterium sp. CCC1.1]MEB0176870.1 TetR/AcrR family transcriptional regulator [Undibacterium sp. CCC3.4]MEB0216102.1 TetR/AcrR family transcriptional regulator [Undibacterium sp. 5I2]WPX42015.1 TetR/AcrR family transcriptional regulator [Undibacterium sp. CCC3.4]